MPFNATLAPEDELAQLRAENAALKQRLGLVPTFDATTPPVRDMPPGPPPVPDAFGGMNTPRPTNLAAGGAVVGASVPQDVFATGRRRLADAARESEDYNIVPTHYTPVGAGEERRWQRDQSRRREEPGYFARAQLKRRQAEADLAAFEQPKREQGERNLESWRLYDRAKRGGGPPQVTASGVARRATGEVVTGVQGGGEGAQRPAGFRAFAPGTAPASVKLGDRSYEVPALPEAPSGRERLSESAEIARLLQDAALERASNQVGPATRRLEWMRRQPGGVMNDALYAT